MGIRMPFAALPRVDFRLGHVRMAAFQAAGIQPALIVALRRANMQVVLPSFRRALQHGITPVPGGSIRLMTYTLSRSNFSRLR